MLKGRNISTVAFELVVSKSKKKKIIEKLIKEAFIN